MAAVQQLSPLRWFGIGLYACSVSKRQEGGKSPLMPRKNICHPSNIIAAELRYIGLSGTYRPLPAGVGWWLGSVGILAYLARY